MECVEYLGLLGEGLGNVQLDLGLAHQRLLVLQLATAELTWTNRAKLKQFN